MEDRFNSILDAPGAEETHEVKMHNKQMEDLVSTARESIEKAIYEAFDVGLGIDFVNQCVKNSLNEYAHDNPNDSNLKKMQESIGEEMQNNYESSIISELPEEVRSINLNDQPRVNEFVEFLSASGFREQHQDYIALINYVDTVEKKYDDILTELNALKEQVGEMHDIKNPLESVLKDTQEKVNDIGQKLNALKDDIITFTQHALEAVKEKGLVVLNEVTGFLKIKEGLQLLDSSLDKMSNGAEKSVQKINAISNEYHEMGNRAANIGRLLLDKESSLVVKENGKLAGALQLPFTKIQNYSSDISVAVRKSIEKVQSLENYMADKNAKTIQVDESVVLQEREMPKQKEVQEMNPKEQGVSVAEVNHVEQQPLSGIYGNVKTAQGNNVFVLSEQGYLHRAAKGLKDIKPGQSFPEYKNKVPKSWAEKGWVKEVSPDALSEIQKNQIHRSETANTIRPAVNIGLEP